jgi:hypothetical protein
MMMNINASALDDDDQKSLLEFLNQKLGREGKRENGVVIFDEKEEGDKLTARVLKPYIKRFLHNYRIRKDFRVLSEEGELKLVRLEVEQEEENTGGST